MPKLVDNKLYLEFSEMVESGVSESYLWKAKSVGSNSWHFIDDPSDRRKVLVGYEELSSSNKKKVDDRWGNPYDLVARQPIREMVINDHRAEDFYRQYRYGNNVALDLRTINKYIRAASWLNMLGEVQSNRQFIKKTMGLTIPEFYLHCADLINVEKRNGKEKSYTGMYALPGDFPASYQRLMNKVRGYQNGSYDYLIAAEYGNKNASKLGRNEGAFDPSLHDKQMAVFRSVAKSHQNLDAGNVSRLVNMVFEKNGWETISESRIYQLMHEWEAELTPGRRGRRTYSSTIAMQVKRKRPEFPTYYCTLDGWTAELLFQEEKIDSKGNRYTDYNGRLVIVVVLDAMNDYPVGYAIGERETPELIREANRNALLHFRELFGGNYKPYQLQSDRYALKNLTPFYQAVAHLHTPAAVGNAKSKVVEPYFKRLNKKYCQLMPNWAGHNINARKENQVNAEFLNMIKKSFPDKAGVIRQLEAIMNEERRSKIAEYMQQWSSMPVDNRTTIDEMSWLMAFGHPVGKPNRITGEGIVKMIAGQSITFDCFDPIFRRNINEPWQIIAEPEDTSRVLAISKDGKQRFLLEAKMVVPMSIMESLPEHGEYVGRIRQFNKEREAEIIDLYASDAEIVEEIIHNTPLALDSYNEAALKLMLTNNKGQQKEGIQDAKGLKASQKKEQKRIAAETKAEDTSWKATQMAYLNSKTDFNQYID